ncbi:MAG: hypothetical protein JWR60_723 [Polaromonas sp.]|nr:hypothetical protein [Polaromonas sp.]
MSSQHGQQLAAQSGCQAFPKRIAVFFYGSFIRCEVMARGGLRPDRIEVARLNGFDIHVSPHACLSQSDRHAVYGVLVWATHAELDTLYSMDGVGRFLPEAVIVQTPAGTLQPAICYIPLTCGDKPADPDYLDALLNAARGYGFPAWYLERLESFYPAAQPV